MNVIKSLLFAVAVLVSTPVFARAPVPIVNYPAVQVASGSGKTLTVDQIRQTIRVAAQRKGWEVMNHAAGKLIAMYMWRTHSITVEITPISGGYSLVYKDSTNMNYAPEAYWDSTNEEAKGVPVIHPFYNRYVNDLNTAIRLEFKTL
ncbi:MAG: hypothetical protein LBD67_00015 [Candidatus Accumulibacter sp.]|jgi:hypothetical protein|nr:hypothetical protein [Accumulibacter sp.]